MAAADLVLRGDLRHQPGVSGLHGDHGGVVRPEAGGCFTMWLPIQIPNKSRLVYAKALGIRPEDIRVIKPFMGGGFGGKMETNLHLAAAVLARKTGRPVRMVNDRVEDFVAGNPRVPMRMDLKMGFMRDGRFAAKEVTRHRRQRGAHGVRAAHHLHRLLPGRHALHVRERAGRRLRRRHEHRAHRVPSAGSATRR